jgi:hypothetical protein
MGPIVFVRIVLFLRGRKPRCSLHLDRPPSSSPYSFTLRFPENG